MLHLFYEKPRFEVEGRDWPNRPASRFVRAGGLSWHVQIAGSGPKILLLHGTGSSAHSFRDLIPRLSPTFTVLAPDLPGHGFTETPGSDGLSLPGMARSLAALLALLEFEPELIVGHSAGVAVALRLCLEGLAPPQGVVSFNGALEPFPGSSGQIFPVMARLLFLNPIAVNAFAFRAGRPSAVERLIRSTGSVIDPVGVACYSALLSKAGHVAGALGMMARWNLEELRTDLPRLTAPLLLITADGDLAVPPKVSEGVARGHAGSQLRRLAGLGHLAHEENPELASEIVRAAAFS